MVSIEAPVRIRHLSLEQREFTRAEAQSDAYHYFHRVASPLINRDSARGCPVYSTSEGKIRSAFIEAGVDSAISQVLLGNQDSDGGNTVNVYLSNKDIWFINSSKNSSIKANHSFVPYGFGVQYIQPKRLEESPNPELVRQVKVLIGQSEESSSRKFGNPNHPEHARYDLTLINKFTKVLDIASQRGILKRESFR